MDTDSSSNTIHEQLKRRQDSFQEAFQIYEPFELNSAYSSPILSAQISQSESIDNDNLKSDSTLMSGASVASKFMYSGSTGKTSKKRGSTRPNHTPRPPNSFILYRRDKHAEILMNSNTERGLNNNAISRVVADMWKKECPEVKALYAAKADEEKQKHYIKYPDYKYQPRKNGKKSKSYQKSEHNSNSIESILTTHESMHPQSHYPFTFENPFSSGWPSQHGSGPYDFHSQLSFNQPPSPQTFYEYRSINDYNLGPMDPNYHF